MSPPHPIVIITEVRLCHFPMAFFKTTTKAQPIGSSGILLPSLLYGVPGSAQSDFSFSFMCKKTMLKMKSPAIMEKALA